MPASEARYLLGSRRFEGMRRLAILRDPFEKIRSIHDMLMGRSDGGARLEAALKGCGSEATRPFEFEQYRERGWTHLVSAEFREALEGLS